MLLVGVCGFVVSRSHSERVILLHTFRRIAAVMDLLHRCGCRRCSIPYILEHHSARFSEMATSHVIEMRLTPMDRRLVKPFPRW